MALKANLDGSGFINALHKMTEAVNTFTAKNSKTTQSTQNLNKSINALNKESLKVARTLGMTHGQLKELRKQYRSHTTQIRSLNKQNTIYNERIKTQNKTITTLSKSIQSLRSQVVALTAAQQRSNRATRVQLNQIGKLQTLVIKQAEKMAALKNVTQKTTGSMGRHSDMLTTVTAHMNRLIRYYAAVNVAMKAMQFTMSALSEGAAYEQSLLTISGIVKKLPTEIKALSDEIQRLGAYTKFTAIEVAEAARFLVMAGLSAEEARKSLDTVVKIATAGNLDLGKAADIATNAMIAFGKTSKDLSSIGDAFISVITRTNSTIESLAASLKYAAPVANALNYTIEDTLILLGVLHDAGIKSSMAGTTLAAAMLKITKASAKLRNVKVATTFKELFNHTVKLPEVMAQINKEMWTASDVFHIFGKRGGRAAIIIGQASEKIAILKAHVSVNNGELQKLTNIMNNSVIVAFKKFESAIAGTKIEAFLKQNKELRAAIADATTWVQQHSKTIKTLIADIILFIKISVKLIQFFIEWHRVILLVVSALYTLKLASFIASLYLTAQGLGVVTGGLFGVKAALLNVTAAIKLLKLSMGAWALIITAVSAALYYLYKSLFDSAAATKKVTAEEKEQMRQKKEYEASIKKAEEAIKRETAAKKAAAEEAQRQRDAIIAESDEKLRLINLIDDETVKRRAYNIVLEETYEKLNRINVKGHFGIKPIELEQLKDIKAAKTQLGKLMRLKGDYQTEAQIKKEVGRSVKNNSAYAPDIKEILKMNKQIDYARENSERRLASAVKNYSKKNTATRTKEANSALQAFGAYYKLVITKIKLIQRLKENAAKTDLELAKGKKAQLLKDLAQFYAGNRLSMGKITYNTIRPKHKKQATEIYNRMAKATGAGKEEKDIERRIKELTIQLKKVKQVGRVVMAEVNEMGAEGLQRITDALTTATLADIELYRAAEQSSQMYYDNSLKRLQLLKQQKLDNGRNANAVDVWYYAELDKLNKTHNSPEVNKQRRKYKEELSFKLNEQRKNLSNIPKNTDAYFHKQKQNAKDLLNFQKKRNDNYQQEGFLQKANIQYTTTLLQIDEKRNTITGRLSAGIKRYAQQLKQLIKTPLKKGQGFFESDTAYAKRKYEERGASITSAEGYWGAKLDNAPKGSIAALTAEKELSKLAVARQQNEIAYQKERQQIAERFAQTMYTIYAQLAIDIAEGADSAESMAAATEAIGAAVGGYTFNAGGAVIGAAAGRAAGKYLFGEGGEREETVLEKSIKATKKLQESIDKLSEDIVAFNIQIKERLETPADQLSQFENNNTSVSIARQNTAIALTALNKAKAEERRLWYVYQSLGTGSFGTGHHESIWREKKKRRHDAARSAALGKWYFFKKLDLTAAQQSYESALSELSKVLTENTKYYKKLVEIGAQSIEAMRALKQSISDTLVDRLRGRMTDSGLAQTVNSIQTAPIIGINTLEQQIAVLGTTLASLTENSDAWLAAKGKQSYLQYQLNQAKQEEWKVTQLLINRINNVAQSLQGLKQQADDWVKKYTRSSWGTQDYINQFTANQTSIDAGGLDSTDEIKLWEDQYDILSKLLDEADASTKALESIRDNVKDTRDSIINSDLNPDQTFARAQIEYNNRLSAVQNSEVGTDEYRAAVESYNAFAKDYLQKAKEFYKSTADYQTIFDKVVNIDMPAIISDTNSAISSTETTTAQLITAMGASGDKAVEAMNVFSAKVTERIDSLNEKVDDLLEALINGDGSIAIQAYISPNAVQHEADANAVARDNEGYTGTGRSREI